MQIERIGGATLYCGDCLEVMPTLGEVDSVVTDPPYGLGNTWTHTGGNRISAQEAEDVNRWDVAPEAALRLMWTIPCEQVVWGGNYLAGILGACRAPLVWDKKQRGMHFADAEIAWTNFDRGTARVLEMHIAAGDSKGAKVHPTQKPTEVMEWSIAALKDAPQTILDPFMGSGTTGVACANLGRKFIGIELERKYFDIACERIDAAYAQGRLFV